MASKPDYDGEKASASESQGQPATNTDTTAKDHEKETIDHDDLCPICHLLLYRPVTTRCGHTLCESCMAHWADVSVRTQMTLSYLDEEPMDDDPNEKIEAKCPMCRTVTTASFNSGLADTLKSRYPVTYAERQAEEEAASTSDGPGPASVETLTVYVGNEHRLIRPAVTSSSNNHDWTFFVRPSRTDVIEQVNIELHPTFRPPVVRLTQPPYRIRRVGWGTFRITAEVILKPGWQWVSDDAEDSLEGRRNACLALPWYLDFTSRGSQGRIRLRIKREETLPAAASGLAGSNSPFPSGAGAPLLETDPWYSDESDEDVNWETESAEDEGNEGERGEEEGPDEEGSDDMSTDEDQEASDSDSTSSAESS